MAIEKEKRKILLVEDEADMLAFLSTLMDAHGFEPVPARSKSEGLQKAREEKPSCIILDGMIRDEEGLALYIQLKRDDRLKHVPVVMLASVPSKTFFHYQKIGTAIAGDAIPEPEGYMETPPEARTLVQLVQQLAKGTP